METIWIHLTRVRYEELRYVIANEPASEEQALADFADVFGLALANADVRETRNLSALAEVVAVELQTVYSTRPQPPAAQPVFILLTRARNQTEPVLPQAPEPTPLPATATPTETSTNSPTMTATSTPTATPSATSTSAPTRTPRFGPTATRTPEPSALPPEEATATSSPTETWTPLPLPGGSGNGTALPQPHACSRLRWSARPDANGLSWDCDTLLAAPHGVRRIYDADRCCGDRSGYRRQFTLRRWDHTIT